MKIALSADCFYPAQLGGPSNAIYWQAKALQRIGHRVTVVATSYGLPSDTPVDRWLIMDCGRVIYTKNPHFYLPVKHIWYGWQAIRNADIVHVNSLFYPASIIWILMSRFAGKPTVWSPHGELSPTALRFRPCLKKVLLKLFRRVSQTVCFHATSLAELTNIQQHFGTDLPVIKIANRMELPPLAERNPQPYLLFMGRLHPIKAIDRLLMALSRSKQFQESNYLLLIAGPAPDKAYQQTLMKLSQELGLSAKVVFVGQVEGQHKERLYANAYVTLLPSHSENFGNVVIESLAQGTPVITSTGTPWQSLITEKAGNWVDNEPEALHEAMDKFLRLPPEQYEIYRINALALARREYNVFTGIHLWERLYESRLQNHKSNPRG
jgi:glycosyltransferase involved in cell wall biosynthesis